MKRVVAFVGNARRRNTYRAVQQFLGDLQAGGDVECEIVALADYRLETCRGCCTCFAKGEEFCPLKDDRDVLIRKIETADGIVFASPNYSFHVSGLMKTLLDRLGFLFHRPRFFGKTFTSIVCQGIYGGGKIVKYLDFVANGLGFNTVRGSCLRTLEPMTEKGQRKIDRTLAAQSRRFRERLARTAFPAPPLLKLMAFRMSRTSMKLRLDAGSRDYAHFWDKGWFESDYYYPTRMGTLKRIAGGFFDSVAAGMARSMETERGAAGRPGSHTFV
jgi:multimeric flavodoxin WrbA